MALLHIALQEGFSDDDVVVRVDGQEVYHKKNVTTRLQIGYADSFELEIKEGAARVEVELATRGLSEAFPVDVTGTTYVGLSVEQGAIRHRLSTQPFGYL